MDSELAPCEPGLALAPAETVVLPYTSVLLEASGGTGAYRFALADSGSGGSVNESTGVYLSGETQDTEDLVVVTDLGCAGQAMATMRVVAALDVAPRQAEVLPEAGFTFDIRGGSGSYACTMRAAASGGSVTSGCGYSAGAQAGVDVVRIEDTETGYYLDATLRVNPAARLDIAGSGHIFIPLGQRFRPEPVGGSGHLVPTVLAGGLMASGDAIVGNAAGSGRVRFADRYTGMSIEVPVTVVPPYTPEVERDGERSGEGVVHSVGDLDGDGYADGVLGFIELSVGAHYSGAVMVYKGGPTGLEAQPVQVFHGTTRIETFGRDVEVADIDKDGEEDLLIGADRSDQGLVNNGGVMIYRGVRGGFFSEQPIRVLRGDRTNDRFGANLVACDFDGDDYLDLAVGAVEAENINVGVPAQEQGAVHVFRGSAAGFADKADFILYGQLPDGATGMLRSVARMYFGQTVRAGDMDGDGRCDLVVGAPEARRDSAGQDGVVLVYQGTNNNNLVLTRTPVRMYAANEDGLFGNAIELDDINGDGRDDLVIAHYQSSGRSSLGGSVHIFLGGSLNDRPPTNPITPDEADWVVHGTTSSEYLGSDVALADFDGDAYADLLIGVARAEPPRRYDMGAVRVFSGAAIRAAIAADPGHDATNDVPALAVSGVISGGRLGQAVGAVGRGGILALAGWDDTFGTEVGAAYYASTTNPVVQTLLMPGEAAGHEFGQGIALFDVDRDGDRDLLIGGPGAAEQSMGANAGLLFYFPAQGTGFADTPVKIGNSYSGHDGSDRYGYAISTAGDFNGDGFEDLAVVARGESRPEGACGGALARAGAVYVFLGRSTGLDTAPAFVMYGPTADGNIRSLRGGLDVNNDGYDDLLVGSYGWGSGGGFAIVHGRPAESATGTAVVCDAELYLGVESNSYLGSAVAPLGDVDGDGCDDVAVGASREDFDVGDQGAVRILWGWGGNGCPSSPAVTTMVLTLPFTQLGTALDGGRDVDGDGIPDLAVGGANFRYDFGYVGAAWVVPGAYVRGLARQSITAGRLPESESTVLATLLPEIGERGRYGVLGPIAASLFGDAVALIPDPVAPGRAALAVGAPRGNYGGSSLAGGVAIYRFVDNALNGQPGLIAKPYAIMGGEVGTTESLLGATLQGYAIDGRPVLVVGAPVSNGRGLDVGAGFVLRL